MVCRKSVLSPDSRPKWTSNLSKLNKNKKDEDGVIYTGNPQILKKICPGEFGTIKPVGYCMIGVDEKYNYFNTSL